MKYVRIVRKFLASRKLFMIAFNMLMTGVAALFIALAFAIMTYASLAIPIGC